MCIYFHANHVTDNLLQETARVMERSLFLDRADPKL